MIRKILPLDPETSWTDDEIRFLHQVEQNLKRSGNLYRWWREDLDANNAYSRRFAMNEETDEFGFYGEPEIDGRSVEVMGCVQNRYAALRSSADLRQLALRDFLRADGDFRYRQLLYKCAHTGSIRRFSEEDQKRIDLRALGCEYEWIVAHTEINNFRLPIPFLSDRLPAFTTGTYLVFHRDFLVEESERYGFGYVFLQDRPELLAFGPGQFEIAFQSFQFTPAQEDQIDVRLSFAVNRPERLLRLAIPRLIERGLGTLKSVAREFVERVLLRIHARCHVDLLASVAGTV